MDSWMLWTEQVSISLKINSNRQLRCTNNDVHYFVIKKTLKRQKAPIPIKPIPKIFISIK